MQHWIKKMYEENSQSEPNREKKNYWPIREPPSEEKILGIFNGMKRIIVTFYEAIFVYL